MIHSGGWGEDRGGDGGGVWDGYGGECGCLKVKARAANWGGSEVMSFSILSLPWPAGITLLSCQSTSPPYFSTLTHTTETEGGRGGGGGRKKLFISEQAS